VVVTQNPTELLSLLRSLTKAGVPPALGSDAGGPEANPFLNIMLAYTAGGAYAERQERVKGRIAPGFAAAFALLSQNVLTVRRPALPESAACSPSSTAK
jgi:predicted amidohydrolase YtcJ